MAPIATETQTFTTPSVKVEIKHQKNELTSPSAGLKTVDYAKFLSIEAASRYPSPLKDIAVKYLAIPGIISFGGGMPHPSTFPVNSLTLSFPYLEKTLTIDGYTPPASSSATPLASYGTAKAADTPELNINLSTALQYGGSGGAAPLVKFMKEHVRRQFGIPYEDWDIVMTNGNTDGMSNILSALCSRGSNVLVESFAYPGTLAGIFPLGISPVPVEIDGEGMIPSVMDEILSSWDASKSGEKPSLVIVVPTGQNPTGTTMSEQRKRDFYAVAQKHDILILSDDPYRALQLHYPSLQGPTPPERITGFLSIDTDGRVLDMSTFSKTVAPGCRCGWITGPTPLIKKLILRNEVTMQAVSGFSVAAILTFLGGLGGQEGYEKYLATVAANYSIRANLMNDAFKKHLPSDLCDWVLPDAGMFIYVKIKAAKHPLISTKSPSEVLSVVFDKVIEHGLITSPSTVFKADPSTPETADEVALRCSFSYLEVEEMEEGARRFGAAIRESFDVAA